MLSAPLIATLGGFSLLMNTPMLFVFQLFGPAPSKLKGDVIVASTGLQAPATPLDVAVAVAVGRVVAVAVAVDVAVDRAVAVAVGAVVDVAVAVGRAVAVAVDVAVAPIVA